MYLIKLLEWLNFPFLLLKIAIQPLVPTKIKQHDAKKIRRNDVQNEYSISLPDTIYFLPVKSCITGHSFVCSDIMKRTMP